MEKITRESVLESFLKKELVQVLEALGETKVDEALTKKQLIALILTKESGIPHFVTKEDLEGHPGLVGEGLKEGDIIFFTEEEAENYKKNHGSEEQEAPPEGTGQAPQTGEQNLPTPPMTPPSGVMGEGTLMKRNARYNGKQYVQGQRYTLSTVEKEELQKAGVI